jgi:hypothetical protein
MLGAESEIVPSRSNRTIGGTRRPTVGDDRSAGPGLDTD